MNKLMVMLVFMVIMTGVVCAQEPNARLSEEAFWAQIDTTTQWGQWLNSTVKPYWDQMSEAMVKYILPTSQIDLTGLSPDEILKRVNAGYVDYYNAIQKITPPTELMAYRSTVLELYALTTKGNLQMNLFDKLNAKSNQELTEVFTKHDVPQEIIKEFIFIRTE